jgi:hypothetical protein
MNMAAANRHARLFIKVTGPVIILMLSGRPMVEHPSSKPGTPTRRGNTPFGAGTWQD